MSDDNSGGILGIAPPSPDARLAKLEAQQGEILAALRAQQQQQKPPVSAGVSDMLAVMNAASTMKANALEEISKTLTVVQQIQGGKVNLEPADADGGFMDSLAKALVGALTPVLLAKLSPGQAPAAPVVAPATSAPAPLVQEPPAQLAPPPLPPAPKPEEPKDKEEEPRQ